MTFDQWMKRVDAVLDRLVGMVSLDLPDVDYWSMYEDDNKPEFAALSALEAAGYRA